MSFISRLTTGLATYFTSTAPTTDYSMGSRPITLIGVSQKDLTTSKFASNQFQFEIPALLAGIEVQALKHVRIGNLPSKLKVRNTSITPPTDTEQKTVQTRSVIPFSTESYKKLLQLAAPKTVLAKKPQAQTVKSLDVAPSIDKHFQKKRYNGQLQQDLTSVSDQLTKSLDNLSGQFKLSDKAVVKIKKIAFKSFSKAVKAEVAELIAGGKVTSDKVTFFNIVYNLSQVGTETFANNLLHKVDRAVSKCLKKNKDLSEIKKIVSSSLETAIFGEKSVLYNSVRKFINEFDEAKLASTTIGQLYERCGDPTISKKDKLDVQRELKLFGDKVTGLQIHFNNRLSLEQGTAIKALNKMRPDNCITEKDILKLRSARNEVVEEGLKKMLNTIREQHKKLCLFKNTKKNDARTDKEISNLKKIISLFLGPKKPISKDDKTEVIALAKFWGMELV